MTYTMTVSPDFSPEHIAGWYIFNTFLQKQLGEAIHLELYDSFESQKNDILNDKVDLIFANPYEASMLIREKGFTAIAAPTDKFNEIVICVKEDSPIQLIEDLRPGCKLSMADDPGINNLGMILLESADLDSENTVPLMANNYILVAKSLINEGAEAGFFLKNAFDDMSKFVKSQIRPIIASDTGVIRHIFLVGPKLKGSLIAIHKLLGEMHTDEKGMSVLNSLGFKRWDDMGQEDTEFMIDLIDTLST